MALSNAPAARRALYDALKVAEYPAPQPGVWFQTPDGDRDFHDTIVVHPDDEDLEVAQQWHSMGAGAKRNEDIAIPVRIDVFREGRDQFAASERAWELAEIVATVLAADRTLGVTGVLDAIPSDISESPTTAQDGRLCRITLTVTAQSRVAGI